MLSIRRLVCVLTVVSAFACYKSTPATADSASASSTASGKSLDKDAARAEILHGDSAFVRGMQTQNVDTIMAYYVPDVVSMGGKSLIKGTGDLRGSYVQAVKNPHVITFQTHGVNFSDDGSTAWDYGTFSDSSVVKGKATKTSGTFLHVWKHVDGKWKIAAEISSPQSQ